MKEKINLDTPEIRTTYIMDRFVRFTSNNTIITKFRDMGTTRCIIRLDK